MLREVEEPASLSVDVHNPDVYVTGLALDYCVYETVKSLQEISREGTYTIYTSMTASIQPQDIVSEMYERLPKKVNLKL